MKYLKYFESLSEPTLREKLESIVDMYNYVCDNDIESFSFVGECNILFFTHVEYTRSGKKPFIFKIDEFLADDSKYLLSEDNIERLNKLYKFSLIKRFDKTIKDIEHILRPMFDLKMLGGDLIDHYKIERYINGWYGKCCFSIELHFDEDLFALDSQEISQIRQGNYTRHDFRDVEKDFYIISNKIQQKLDEIGIPSSLARKKELDGRTYKDYLDSGKYNLKYSIDNNTHLQIFDKLNIRLEPVN